MQAASSITSGVLLRIQQSVFCWLQRSFETPVAQSVRTVWKSRRRDNWERMPEVQAYNRSRRVYRQKLDFLQRQWRLEYLSKARLAKAEEKRIQQIKLAEQESVLRQAMKEREEEKFRAQLRRAELAVEVSMARLDAAVRQERRLTVRAMKKDQRKQLLLEASRAWVRPTELDQRIEHALDNPLPFGFAAGALQPIVR